MGPSRLACDALVFGTCLVTAPGTELLPGQVSDEKVGTIASCPPLPKAEARFTQATTWCL